MIKIEIVISSLALIVSVISAWYAYVKNKDYIDIIISRPMFLTDSVYVHHEAEGPLRTGRKDTVYTSINILNASNHDIGFFDFELYTDDKKLNRLEPSKKDGQKYLSTTIERKGVKPRTTSKIVTISDEENGSSGNIQAKSHTELLIAAYDETGSLKPIDNINLRIKIIRPSLWSYIPFISSRAKRYIPINHNYSSHYIVDNHGMEYLEDPIIKRI